MKKVLATLAAVLAAIMIVSVGCSSGQSTTTTTTTTSVATTSATTTQSTTTKSATTQSTAATATTTTSTTTKTSSPTPSGPSGTLTIAVPALAAGGFDPPKNPAVSYVMWPYGAAIFDSLVTWNTEGAAVPGIAERWETSADGKTWTFYIRKGVKFQDGSDLTGADVKFSTERIIAPDSIDSGSTTLRAALDRVELKDPYTVVMHLKSPQGELWRGLNQPANGANLVLPKKYIEEKGADYFNQHPIGSGPYKLVKYDPQKSVELEAVGNWRVMPKIKTIKVIAVPEEAVRIAMLKTGEIDMTEIAPDSIKDVKGAGLNVVSYTTAVQSGLALYYDRNNPSTYPIGNPNVRKALSLAINREEMGSKLFSGYAKPCSVMGVPVSAYFFDPNVLKPDPYDPAQAKKLLADAGYGSGFSMKLFDAPWAPWMSIHNQAIAGYWQAIGVNTQLVPIDTAALLGKIRPNRSPDLMGNAGTYKGEGSTAFQMNVYYGSTGYHGSSSPQLDSALAQVMSTTDMTQRKALATQFALAAQQERAMIGVLNFDSIWGLSNRIASWTPVKGIVAPSLSFETTTLK